MVLTAKEIDSKATASAVAFFFTNTELSALADNQVFSNRNYIEATSGCLFICRLMAVIIATIAMAQPQIGKIPVEIE